MVTPRSRNSHLESIIEYGGKTGNTFQAGYMDKSRQSVAKAVFCWTMTTVPSGTRLPYGSGRWMTQKHKIQLLKSGPFPSM